MLKFIKHFLNNNVQIRIAAIIGAFLFAFYDTIVSFLETWSGRDDYSHGFIVPLASLYFVYVNKARLCSVEIRPNITLGISVTAVGALLLMLGYTGSVITLQQLAVLIVLPGLVILLYGVQMFKILLLPLGYLILMVPVMFDVLLNPLHWPFQLLGAKIAAIILGSLGIPVYHTAQYIMLPNISLEVANECSGIRYLISIIALAIPLAILSVDTWKRRIVLITSSILIGILANPLRISLIGLWVYKGGSILHGPGHMLQGYFVSAVGFVFLFIMAYFISETQRSVDKKSLSSKTNQDIPGNLSQSSNHGFQIAKKTVTQYIQDRIFIAQGTAIAILMMMGLFINFYVPVPLPLTALPKSIPLEIDGWEGKDIDQKSNIFMKLQYPDFEIQRTYKSPSGEIVNVIAGYYNYQRQGKEFINYSMQKLYDGAEEYQIRIAADKFIAAKRVVIDERGKQQLIVYWYEMGDYITSNNVLAKLITSMRGILERKTNGAIILIAIDITNIHDSAEISNIHDKFLSAMYPLLKKCLHSY